MAPEINVQGKKVMVISRNLSDFISLTDIARHRDVESPADIV